jgi:cbb3-type cytochrome oxidase cytochrome c subunit
VGRREPVGALVAGVLGLLILSVLLGVVAPAVPAPSNGVRTSNHQFSAAALHGREVYLEAGCGSCHTQVVRNLVTDVGLGPVTLSDSNQVLGYRRYGPDLAAVGARISDRAALESTFGGGHPRPGGLSPEELDSLVAYLLESR